MAARYKITGGDRLMKLLKSLPAEAQKEVKATIRKEAEDLAAAVRAAAPQPPGRSGEATGALRDAVKVRTRQGGLRAQVGIFGPTKRQKVRNAGAAAGLKARRGLSLAKAKRVAAQLSGDIFYAHFVEFGTKNAPAQPFLFPTFRTQRTRIRSGIAKAAKRAIETARK